MGKSFDLSREANDAVCFYCRSYHHREYVLREMCCPAPVRAAYSSINNAIREAVGAECDARLMEIIIEDIGNGRGFKYSPAVCMIGEAAYKRIKRIAKINIAKRLGLCR